MEFINQTYCPYYFSEQTTLDTMKNGTTGVRNDSFLNTTNVKSGSKNRTIGETIIDEDLPALLEEEEAFLPVKKRRLVKKTQKR